MQIDTGKIKEAIKKHKAKKVAIQIPEGLKVRALEISDSVEALGVKAVLVADPCFGACDIPDYLMKELGCDMIIHFAHSQYVKKTEIPVVYVEYRSDKDPTGILEKNVKKLSGVGKVGLVTTVQYIDYLDRMKTVLDKNGIKIFEGDIIACRDATTGKSYPTVIEWDEDSPGYWYGVAIPGCHGMDSLDEQSANNDEVIGNIYENPDLLTPTPTGEEEEG